MASMVGIETRSDHAHSPFTFHHPIHAVDPSTASRAMLSRYFNARETEGGGSHPVLYLHACLHDGPPVN